MSYYLGEDNSDSQRNGGVRKYVKVGAALIGGACLVLLAMVGISVIAPGLQSTGADTSTNLIGMPTSLRASPTPGFIPLTPAQMHSLPGASPWKELGIAAFEDAQQCSRDVSTQAHSNFAAAMSKLSPQDRDMVVNFGRRVQKRASNIKQGEVKGAPLGLETGMVGPIKGLWDPFGFTTSVSKGQLLFYREAELKHGRVCMLAVLGFIVQEKFQINIGYGAIDIPAIQAFGQANLAIFWPAFIVALGALEVPSFGRFNYDTEGLGFGVELQPGEEPGAVGFDPLGLKPSDPAELEKRQNQEILHGRLAMIATAGAVAQELLTQAKLGEGGIFGTA